MGLIRAFAGALGGELASQWLEAIEADDMSNGTVMTRGSRLRKNDRRDSNKKGQDNIISNGSKILVHPNQFMLLMDGGKIIDYTAEPGGYTVSTSSAPSLFNGQFKDTLKDTFERFKFGGAVAQKQEVVFINLQEIRDITFGTTTPINYFDDFYNAELYLRANGYYSIKIENPIKFFMEVISHDAQKVEFNDIKSMFTAEFLGALATTLNQMSADGFRISHIASKTTEVSKYMAKVLDDDWLENRGFEVKSVGFNAITFDEESKKLIAIRSQGAMLGDANIREGYVQGSVARGIEAAGSNAGGSANAFMGIGMAMNTGGIGQMSSNNQQQMANDATKKADAAAGTAWTCPDCKESGNTGPFCKNCGAKKAVDGTWVCPTCKKTLSDKFCSDCGTKMPAKPVCSGCGKELLTDAKFCPECGNKIV